MRWRRRGVTITLLLVAAGKDVFAQTSRETAWMAYHSALQQRRDRIPQLAALIDTYQSSGYPSEASSVAPADAAIESVADALIQLDAHLPATTIMHLYPNFPAQSLILLAHSPDRTAALLTIFQGAQTRDVWLAAGNLLSERPPREFLYALLEGLVVHFRFAVVSPGAEAARHEGGGCAGDSYMIQDEAFHDWPKVRMYAFVIGADAQNLFAPGIHPVGFRTWATTDYRDSWGEGDCTTASSRNWRIGLLAQTQKLRLEQFPLKAEIDKTITFSTQAALRDDVSRLFLAQKNAYREIVERFVSSGLLWPQDTAELRFKCRMEVRDERASPVPALPQLAEESCPAPPPERMGIQVPE